MTAEVVAPPALPETFWAKVDITLTCWLWTGAVTSRGYGCFSIAGRRYQVHRLSYASANGAIPESLTIDHLREAGVCTSKLCVRPDHLESVTRSENSQRYHRSVTRCAAGHLLTLRPGDRQRRCRPCETARQKARRADLPPVDRGESAAARAGSAGIGEGGAPGFTPVSGRTASPP